MRGTEGGSVPAVEDPVGPDGLDAVVGVRDRDTEPDPFPEPADSDPTLDESTAPPSKSGFMAKVVVAGDGGTARGVPPDEVIAAMRELYAEGETETALLLASMVRGS